MKWLNGFCTAAFISFLVLLGYGLWYHNENLFVPASFFLFFSICGWIGSLAELMDPGCT